MHAGIFRHFTMRLLVHVTFLVLLNLNAFPFVLRDDHLASYINSGKKHILSYHYDSAGYYFEKALALLQDQGNWELECELRNQYVTALWKQIEYDLAEKESRKNITYCLKYLGEDHPLTGDAMLNMGILSYLNGKEQVIIPYLTKARHIYEHNFGHWSDKTALAYEWMGTWLESVNDRENASGCLYESLKIWQSIRGANHPDLADIYRYLGLYYKRYGMLDSALSYFNRARRLFDEKYGMMNPGAVKCLNNMCDVYEVVGEFDTALILYNQALSLIDRNNESHHQVLQMTLFNLAEYYFRQNEFRKGIRYFQEIFSIFAPGPNYDDILVNPDNVVDARRYYLNLILFYKARAFQQLYKEDSISGLKYLIGSFDCYRLAFQIIENEKRYISNYGDFLAYLNRNSGLIAEISMNALQLSKATKDTHYVSAALKYMESSRDLELMNPLMIADEMLDDGRSGFQHDILNLQNEYLVIQDKLLTEKEEDVIEKLRYELNELIIEMDLIPKQQIRNHAEVKYLDRPMRDITIQGVQRKLQENQALIAFEEFCGDYSTKPYEIIMLIMTQSGFEHKIINGEQAYQLIRNYYDSLSVLFPRHHPIVSGLEIYNLLLKPIEKYNRVDELIIIPSQHTSLLPFDALPLSLSKNGEARYMINEYTVWRMFSIHEFLETRKGSKRNDYKLLAMAPSFSKEKKMEISKLTKRDTSLINLSGALEECMKISAFLPSKLITGPQATEKEFKEIALHYPMIHLSTHGVPAGANTRMIQLAFSNSNDTDENGYLNMYEIFNMHFSTELIVLSACKTGVGELSRGEGNLNLAWAFTKAGAKSSVVSLWDANDYASSVIMPAFYKYLSKGYKKPHALRQAKLDFLETSDHIMKDPYFWAGFGYYGDDAGINIQDHGNRILLIILLATIGIAIGVILLFTQYHSGK